MKRNRWTALLLAALMLLTLLTACGESPTKAAQTESAEPEAASEEQTQDTLAQEEEFFLEREEGCNQLTLYWNDPGADYSKCDVWVWFPGRDGSGQLFHPCAYGAKWWASSSGGTAPTPAVPVGARPPRTLTAIALPLWTATR